MNYFDKDETAANLSGTLPHWRQKGKTYFVTFRTADSIPQEKLRLWEEEKKAWLAAHPEPHDAETKNEFYDRFPRRLQQWLDAGYGACLLARPELKQIVEDALRFFAGQRYELDEFIVMPNHVHVVVAPFNEYELSEILHSWKSSTASKINKMVGRTGPFWQKESFDHLIRSPEQHERIRQYIRDNPKAAKTSRLENQRQDAAATTEQPACVKNQRQGAAATIEQPACIKNQRQDAAATFKKPSCPYKHNQDSAPIVAEASSLCGLHQNTKGIVAEASSLCELNQKTGGIVAEASSLCGLHQNTEGIKADTHGKS